MHRIFGVSVASVYPHYVTKVEKRGRTIDELDQVIEDPLMQKLRYLDKLVDEPAKGRPMEKILRG